MLRQGVGAVAACGLVAPEVGGDGACGACVAGGVQYLRRRRGCRRLSTAQGVVAGQAQQVSLALVPFRASAPAVPVMAWGFAG
jgi:hypothetical protein